MSKAEPITGWEAMDKMKLREHHRGKVNNKIEITPDEIIEHGKVAFSMYWDSGGPGAGADFERIYRWRDRYAASLTYDDPMGPYDSLLAAVKAAELHFVSDAVVSISSDELSAQEIARILRYQGAPPFSLQINGEVWSADKKKRFVRKPG